MKRIFQRAVKNGPTSNSYKPSRNNKVGRGVPTVSKKSKPDTFHESNLSAKELIGLKSLKKRVSKGDIVVTQTDKSKRFSVLTRQQYIESGMQHTKKDLEIDPKRVKRIQNTVNDHVKWLGEMSNLGSNWQHESRMRKNICDKGEQVCNMSILVKDHKSWKHGSEGPIPSRPVISGNTGLNCHLSEIISQIIEPIAYEQNSRDIDSTDDMIAKIEKLNSKLKDFNNKQKPDIVTNSNTVETEEKSLNEVEKKFLKVEESVNTKFNRGDIRSFGKVGMKTSDSTSEENRKRLKEQIEALKAKRRGDQIIPDLCDRMKVGSLIDKIEGGETIFCLRYLATGLQM